MRRCQREGCDVSLDDHRATARYCSTSCRTAAHRQRAAATQSAGRFDWAALRSLDRRGNVTSGLRAQSRVGALLVLTALLTLAGCGGGKHAKHPVSHIAPAVRIVDGHACSSSDQVMQCVLSPPAALLKLQGLVPFELQGVDFAWTKIAPAQAGSFGASYDAHDTSKGWTPSLIGAYHHAGRGTVAVFEDSGSRALDGCPAGRADAQFAEGQLTRWGYPHSHFDMAIDFDANGPDVLAYFTCASAAEPGLVGDYGGAGPTDYLCAHHVVTLSWATYAWLYRTGGVWPSPACAPLQQYLNGSAFDHDRALAANYGQFPTPAQPKPPANFSIYPLHAIRLYNQKVSERLTVERWWQRGCQNPPKRAVCVTTSRHLHWFEGRLETLAHGNWSSKHAREFKWPQRHYRIARILDGRGR